MTDAQPYALQLDAIARIRSPYQQRFGIPRQAGLVPSAASTIVFLNNEFNLLALRGLDDFTHLWVIFAFHQQHYPRRKALVTPPRLGGKKTMGVYATRSPNRPNPIGISAVELNHIEHTDNQLLVHIRGGDFLDDTPVLDIKPYVPFADAHPQAGSSWVYGAEQTLPVQWSEQASRALQFFCEQDQSTQLLQIRDTIDETVAQDPRPAHERNRDGKPGQHWNMKISGLDVRWSVIAGIARVIALKRA